MVQFAHGHPICVSKNWAADIDTTHSADDLEGHVASASVHWSGTWESPGGIGGIGGTGNPLLNCHRRVRDCPSHWGLTLDLRSIEDKALKTSGALKGGGHGKVWVGLGNRGDR